MGAAAAETQILYTKLGNFLQHECRYHRLFLFCFVLFFRNIAKYLQIMVMTMVSHFLMKKDLAFIDRTAVMLSVEIKINFYLKKLA